MADMDMDALRERAVAEGLDEEQVSAASECENPLEKLQTLTAIMLLRNTSSPFFEIRLVVYKQAQQVRLQRAMILRLPRNRYPSEGYPRFLHAGCYWERWLYVIWHDDGFRATVTLLQLTYPILLLEITCSLYPWGCLFTTFSRFRSETSF